MTEGYLRGWLTFDSKTQLSRLREEFIISTLEKRMLLDASKTKLEAISAIVSGNVSRGSVDVLSKELKSYTELALPYLSEKSILKNNPAAQKAQDFDYWRTALAQKKASLDNSPKKEEVLIPVMPTTYE